MASSHSGFKNPFPGLRPFHEDEEQYFFGRETKIDAMVDKLSVNKLLAVLGESGSGKSSLVYSGLVPALRRGLMTSAGSRWRVANFRPGANPIYAMAETLSIPGVLFDDFNSESLSLLDLVQSNLKLGRMGLIDLYNQARIDSSDNLLIIVDQFEELFRYDSANSADENAKRHVAATEFISLLLAAHEEKHLPIYFVFTMRSDFLGDCTRFANLPEAINEGQYLVPRMTREERRQAITGPVSVCGAEIDPVLVNQLLNDGWGEADELSILQHALNRTFDSWSGSADQRITLDHYRSIGTVADALNAHAEKLFVDLSGKQQIVCEKVFKAVTDTATDARGIRRPTTLKLLGEITGYEKHEIVDAISAFAHTDHSFLMPLSSSEPNDLEVIDISHESVMRNWQRLELWVDEEAESARLYKRLVESSRLYVEGKAGLIRGVELQTVKRWKNRNNPNQEWSERYHAESWNQVSGFLDRSLREAQLGEMKDALRRKFIWVAAPLALFLAMEFSFSLDASSERLDLKLFYLPLAALFGYAYVNTGFKAILVSAYLLLPGSFSIAGWTLNDDLGLYLTSCFVCMAFSSPELLVDRIKRFSDSKVAVFLVLLLLNLDISGPAAAGYGLSFEFFYFQLIFCLALGFTSLSSSSFSSLCLVAIIVSMCLDTIAMYLPWPNYLLALRTDGSPGQYVLLMVFFALGRVLHGMLDRSEWTNTNACTWVLAVLFVVFYTTDATNAGAQLVIPDIGLFGEFTSRYSLFKDSIVLVGILGFLLALRGGKRGVHFVLWTSILLFILLKFLYFNFQDEDGRVEILVEHPGSVLTVRMWLSLAENWLSPITDILFVFTLSLLGSGLRKRSILWKEPTYDTATAGNAIEQSRLFLKTDLYLGLVLFLVWLVPTGLIIWLLITEGF